MQNMENFKPKPKEELKAQLGQVAEKVGNRLTPESQNGGLLSMTIDEIKNKFPLRYDIYRKLLISQKNKTEIDEKEISEMKTWLTALNNLDKYIENHKDNEAGRTLRERQFTVFEAIRDFLERGEKEGYIKLPTGAGKTVIFSELIESLRLKTLVVVPTQILVEQTGKEIEKFTEDLDIGKIYTYAKNHGDDVTITTYSSLINKIKDGSINPKDYKCLILDEAHKALSEKRIESISGFDDAIKLGFTATPEYSEDKNVAKLLSKEICSLSIKEAVKEKVLSGFSVYLVQTNIDLSEVKVTSTGEYNQEDLERAINKEARNKAGVDVYRKMFDGERAVVYCCGVAHAENMARLYNEQGISANFVSGKQGKTEREQILNDFKEGKIKVLCNSDILIEGFDEKKASVCINLKPTLSKIVAEQRAGRVLRIDETNLDKIGRIVDFVDVYDQGRGGISFADIVGEAEVYQEEKEKSGADNGNETEQSRNIKIREDIKLEFKIITEAKEVVRILSETGLLIDKEKIEHLPFEELKKEVQVLKIKDFIEYEKKRKENHPNWMSSGNLRRQKGWKNADDFFGREVVEFLSFEDTKKEVQSLGIKTRIEYKKEKKENHPKWRCFSDLKHEKGWKGADDFFDREAVKFLSFEDTKKEVRGLGIKTKKEYEKKRKENHPNWRCFSDLSKEEGWKSSYDFFNKERKEFLSFGDTKKEVRDLGIKTITEYEEERKKHPNLRSYISLVDQKEWKGWDDFLGRGKKEF
ncbi:MAG: DEAD/DEAH box helicase [bacterium]